MNDGFINVDLISPKVEVGNPAGNIEEIIKILKTLKSDIALFPELAITSYSCQDFFLFDELREENDKALKKLLDVNPYKGLLVVGGIFSYESALFNVAFVIKENKILGIVPKYYLPNYQEFGEPRWFTAGLIAKRLKKVKIFGEEVPFGMIVFKCINSDFNLGVGIEICEDVWAPISPSNIMSLNGANVFLNLSASNEYLSKDKKRDNMVSEASRKNRGAYLYVSSNPTESSSGLVFGSSEIACLYGETLLSDHTLTFENKINSVSIDLGYIDNLRKKDSPYKESLDEFDREFETVEFSLENNESPILIESHPFVLKKNDKKSVERILDLQAYGFGKRLLFLHTEKIILGVSGGVDSTMALIAAYRTCEVLKIDPVSSIIPVFLPYVNSSERTKGNAEKLVEAFKLNPIIIPINEQVDALLKSIDDDNKDITYENAQVRVRTTVLMELANKYKGLMLGTSDLSEIAMGYSTYNGDHMSMYNINASLSKTMIQSILGIYAEYCGCEELKNVLLDIVDTPISAELNEGQLTEKEIGKYEYIDFILFRFLRRGDSKERIIKMMKYASFDLTEKQIEETVNRFFKRFFSQQYKRNASPDALKVINSSLDSHLDFKLVSDVKR
ncbi:MAG: NAD(+) synthase [Bacillales bacterium]|nr:NAD(+) synthase [Bacillales bacterium]